MICRQWINEDFILNEGSYLTPYHISKIIKENDSLDEKPSSGAVTKVLQRWHEQGYAHCRVQPYAFERFSELGLELGHEMFYEKFPVKRKSTKD